MAYKLNFGIDAYTIGTISVLRFGDIAKVSFDVSIVNPAPSTSKLYAWISLDRVSEILTSIGLKKKLTFFERAIIRYAPEYFNSEKSGYIPIILEHGNSINIARIYKEDGSIGEWGTKDLVVGKYGFDFYYAVESL